MMKQLTQYSNNTKNRTPDASDSVIFVCILSFDFWDDCDDFEYKGEHEAQQSQAVHTTFQMQFTTLCDL